MANVNVWHATWVDAGETGLQPGHEHNWVMWGLNYTDVVAITAGPLNSSYGDQVLVIKNVKAEADSAHNRRCYFTVQNVGPVRAIGYAVNFSIMSP